MSIALLFLLLLGIINGVISSLVILFSKYKQRFSKGIALVIFTFSITYLVDFFNQFGNQINFRPVDFIHFVKLTFLVPVLITFVYYEKFKNRIRIYTPFIIFSLLPYLLTLFMSIGIISLEGFWNMNASVIEDIVVFFWLIFLIVKMKSIRKDYKSEYQILLLFTAAYFLSAFNNLIIRYFIYFQYDFWVKSYSYFLYTNIFIASLVIYIISFKALFYFLKRKKKKKVELDIKISKKQLDILQSVSENQLFLDGTITKEKMAIKLNIDSKSLSEIIRSQNNMTYNEFINGLRLDYFLELLKTSDLKKNYHIWFS